MRISGYLLGVLLILSGMVDGRMAKAEQEIHLEQSLVQGFQSVIEKAVREREEKLEARFGLAFKDAELPLEFYWRGDEVFHAASTMKTPVMIEVFRQAEAGRFCLEDTRIISPIFHSLIDDSTFECGGYAYIQNRIGQPETILKLTEQMMVVSDNLATNMLITLCGAENITATARALGAENTSVLRCVQDIKAFDAGLSNTLTARDLVILSEKIETNQAASEASCAEMRRILLAQEYNTMIPALLPEGVKVGHKTGSITGVRNDAGTVYAPFGNYYLAILSDGHQDGDAGVQAIAELSRLIYDELEKLKTPMQ